MDAPISFQKSAVFAAMSRLGLIGTGSVGGTAEVAVPESLQNW